MFTVVHSEQMAWPGPVVNTGSTVTFPKSGSVQFIVNVCGGTAAGIALENGLETPSDLCKRILNVAGVSMPRSKFIVRVVPPKLALKPRPRSHGKVRVNKVVRLAKVANDTALVYEERGTSRAVSLGAPVPDDIRTDASHASNRAGARSRPYHLQRRVVNDQRALPPEAIPSHRLFCASWAARSNAETRVSISRFSPSRAMPKTPNAARMRLECGVAASAMSISRTVVAA